MAITRERTERRTTELRIASVECDRCGTPLRHGSGFAMSPDYPFDGVYVRGVFFPPSGNANELERIEAELCEHCTRELLVWIGEGAHVGRHNRDLVENV